MINRIKNFFAIEFSENRVYGLDILRSLAILEVVYAHGQTFLPKQFWFIYDIIGFDGVTLFFVLSGFLIGRILIRTLENSPPTTRVLLHFWKRRWWRTLPNYFLVLAFLLVHHSITKEFRASEHLSYFIFSQNLFYEHPWFFGEAWSLSVEEWFYFLIPILIFLFIRFARLPAKRSFFIVIVLIIISVFAFRVLRFHYLALWEITDFDAGKTFRMQVFTRLDSIMFGVLGAYIFSFFSRFWNSHIKKSFWLGIILIVGIQVSKNLIDERSFYSCVVMYSLLSFAFLCLLPYFNQLKRGKGKFYKSITCVSLISYSMYLLNLNIVYWVIVQNLPWELIPVRATIIAYFKFLVFWLITGALSTLLYKYYEVPMMSLRDRKT